MKEEKIGLVGFKVGEDKTIERRYDTNIHQERDGEPPDENAGQRDVQGEPEILFISFCGTGICPVISIHRLVIERHA